MWPAQRYEESKKELKSGVSHQPFDTGIEKTVSIGPAAVWYFILL